MADLVDSVLGPLRQARGGAQPLLDTLSAYFDSGCVATEAARRLSLSVRALTYRLERIHTLTAADPADPPESLHPADCGDRCSPAEVAGHGSVTAAAHVEVDMARGGAGRAGRSVAASAASRGRQS